jgi:hypothetical protein
MGFTFTEHALQQIAERALDLDVVKRVLNTPEERFREQNGRYVYQSIVKVSGKEGLLRVFVEENATIDHTVVTAYWTTRIQKYRRQK